MRTSFSAEGIHGCESQLEGCSRVVTVVLRVTESSQSQRTHGQCGLKPQSEIGRCGEISIPLDHYTSTTTLILSSSNFPRYDNRGRA